jgi:hypothetical protein
MNLILTPTNRTVLIMKLGHTPDIVEIWAVLVEVVVDEGLNRGLSVQIQLSP